MTVHPAQGHQLIVPRGGNTGSDDMGMTYQGFLEALRQRESGGDYQVVNAYGFLGAYQFGEAALVDLGFVNVDGNLYDNDFSGGFTAKQGIHSVSEFLQSPAAQDSAADEWFELLWSYSKAAGLDQYLGDTIDGTMITVSGIVAGAHLLGTGAVQDYLESGGITGATDQLGTSVAEYIALFAGYDMPFLAGKPGESLTDPITGCPVPLAVGIGLPQGDETPAEITQPVQSQTAFNASEASGRDDAFVFFGFNSDGSEGSDALLDGGTFALDTGDSAATVDTQGAGVSDLAALNQLAPQEEEHGAWSLLSDHPEFL